LKAGFSLCIKLSLRRTLVLIITSPQNNSKLQRKKPGIMQAFSRLVGLFV